MLIVGNILAKYSSKIDVFPFSGEDIVKGMIKVLILIFK